MIGSGWMSLVLIDGMLNSLKISITSVIHLFYRRFPEVSFAAYRLKQIDID
jgi:hypothetical protein